MPEPVLVTEKIMKMAVDDLRKRAAAKLRPVSPPRRMVTYSQSSASKAKVAHGRTLGAVMGGGVRRFSRQRYTVDQVIKAIDASGGLQYRAAEILGCAPSTLYNYIHAYPEIQAAYVESQNNITNMARANVAEAIADEKDLGVSQWWLGRRAPEFSPTGRLEIVKEVIFRVVYDTPSNDALSESTHHIIEGEVVESFT